MAGFLDELKTGGFNFNNCKRNAALEQLGLKQPNPTKTGTTIAGIIFKDGVVLGADTRSTNDTVVADKDCIKIHRIANNIYCCGAGVGGDTEMTTRKIESSLELMRLNTGRQPRVVAANRLLKQHLYRYQGHITAALVLGGYDITGPYLSCVLPHGSTDILPFATMGSGSLAAMAVFESRYKLNMEKQEAIQLVHDAIAAGIFNDLGSGSNVDLCVITKDNTEFLRHFNIAAKKGVKQGVYDYPKGTTVVLSETVEYLEEDILGTEVDTPSKSQEHVMMITA